MRKLRAFVSYSRQDDVAFVRRTCQRLDVECFIDVEDLVPGDSLPERITAAIHRANVFVLVHSRNSVARDWVRRELDEALALHSEGKIRILALILDEQPPMVPIAGFFHVDCQQERERVVADALERTAKLPPCSRPGLEPCQGFPLENGLCTQHGGRATPPRPKSRPSAAKQLVRVGALVNGQKAPYARNGAEAFHAALRERLGPTDWLERFAMAIGSPVRGADEANEKAYAELVEKLGQEPDYLVTVGSEVSAFAHRYRPDLPRIFAAVTDPISLGLVKSYDGDASRGKVAGIRYGVETKRVLEFFRDAYPGLRLGLVYSWDYPQDVTLFEEAQSLQHSVGVELVPIETRLLGLTPQQSARADLFFGRYHLCSNLQSFLASTDKPIVGASRTNLERGALACVGCDDLAVGQRAATEILLPHLEHGTPLSQFPVLRPRLYTGFSDKEAIATGLHPTPSLRERADVIVR